jgi:virulence-associated protein VapD
MYALAFDLEVAEAQRLHPVGATRAYSDIGKVLIGFGFQWTQGSLYTLDNEDMSILFQAIQALMALPWFAPSVRDIRAFRVEQWSDFTATVKGNAKRGKPTGPKR